MSDALIAVRQAAKAGIAAIEKQIKELNGQKAKLAAIMGEGTAVKREITPGAKAANKGGNKGGKRGPGMLNLILPWMEGKASVKAKDMLGFLHSTADYKGAKINAVYATVANELKRPNSRLERIGDGEYRVSASYFARPVEGTQAPAEQPAVQPEAVSA